MSAVLLDGARRAATYAAMLFSLNAPPPTAAKPQAELRTAADALTVDGSVAESGLTLAAHHLDVRIAGGSASVQALLLLRNDQPTAVAVHYLLPQPARLVRGDAAGLPAGGDIASLCDDADLPLELAEQVEITTGRLVRRHDVIVVAPGEQVGVELQREVPLDSAGGVYRLQLPLPIDRNAPWVPRFTADVTVEADRPIKRLWSPTHRALVDGLGEHNALLSVPDGFVYRQAQITVEFELDAGSPGPPVAARRPSGGE